MRTSVRLTFLALIAVLLVGLVGLRQRNQALAGRLAPTAEGAR